MGVWKDNDAHRVQFAAPVALSPADSLICISPQPRERCQSTGMEEGFQCKQLEADLSVIDGEGQTTPALTAHPAHGKGADGGDGVTRAQKV